MQGPRPPTSVLGLLAAAKSLQSCPTLCNPMDCSPPGSSIHGVFQARVPERGALAFSIGLLNQQEKNFFFFSFVSLDFFPHWESVEIDQGLSRNSGKALLGPLLSRRKGEQAADALVHALPGAEGSWALCG